MDQTISITLKDLCISPGLLGYEYLRYGIKIALEDPMTVHHITKQIYPQVAKQFNTTPTRVERAMRHAIEVAWSEKNVYAREVIFRRTAMVAGEQPTNSAFIATVADFLKISQKGVCHAD